MDIMEQAEWQVWEYINDREDITEEISVTGTVENLMNDGWTPTEIAAGKADAFIFDNICWL